MRFFSVCVKNDWKHFHYDSFLRVPCSCVRAWKRVLLRVLTEPLSDVFTEWVPEEEEEVHLIAEPLGYVWIEVGSRRPKPGTELIHKGLAAALLHKVHFNEEEFELLNIDPSDLKVDSYVKTGSV